MPRFRTRQREVTAEQNVRDDNEWPVGWWAVHVEGDKFRTFMSPADFAAKYEPIPDEPSEGEAELAACVMCNEYAAEVARPYDYPDLAGFAREILGLVVARKWLGNVEMMAEKYKLGHFGPGVVGRFILHPSLRDEK